MLFALSADASAERLLTPVAAASAPSARIALPGVARSRTLALGRRALADLRARPVAALAEFPLGADGTATLDLARAHPFAAGARVDVVGADGVERVALPDRAYFAGTVRGEPASRVFLAAGPDRVRGFVASRGEVWIFGPDAAGVHRTYALRDVSPGAYPPPGAFCTNDFHRGELAVAPPAAALAPLAGAAPPVAASGALKQADVAIDTDYELFAKFGSSQATLDYLADLLAAANVIYERDLQVRLAFSYIRLFSTAADPWTAPASDTYATLTEVVNYWLNPMNNMQSIAGSYDLVHFISGKAVYGGIAYVGQVCHTFGFGVSQVYGSFNAAVPSQTWDLIVLTHEIGHNVGSEHTHCYDPPVDKCYNQESGCWNGPVEASQGTIMSYCHLLAGGLANIDLLFGNTVSATIATTVDSASCLGPVVTAVCGDGVVEGNEECDDGGTAAGDGCAPNCQREPLCGDGFVDDPEECDDGGTAAGDGCAADCQREQLCGDGFVDDPEECDDGGTAAGDGCAADCTVEPRCGDGTVDAGEECDDGNDESEDGCSAACHAEPCLVLTPMQTAWVRSLLTVQRGKKSDRLSLVGDFGLPMKVANLGPSTAGVRLRIESSAGEPRVDVTLPPGPQWSARRRRWIYRGGAGSPGGIRRLVLLDRTTGGIPEVLIRISGRGLYPVGAADLPLRVLVVLGDPAAGRAGACGRFIYGGASCGARGGVRFICR
jgi:cysteine-rich repeat protein